MSSAFTLATCVRDHQEAQLLERTESLRAASRTGVDPWRADAA